MSYEEIHLGSDNVIIRQLLRDGEPEPNATRVKVTIAGVCVDSVEHPDEVALDGDTVTLKLGGFDIPPGLYELYIKAYDGLTPNGIAWRSFENKVFAQVHPEVACVETP